jgi:hypothetical protein
MEPRLSEELQEKMNELKESIKCFKECIDTLAGAFDDLFHTAYLLEQKLSASLIDTQALGRNIPIKVQKRPSIYGP